MTIETIFNLKFLHFKYFGESLHLVGYRRGIFLRLSH